MMLVLGVGVPVSAEETATTTTETTTTTSALRESLIAKIKELLLQIEALKGEIKSVQTELYEAISDSLEEGMTHEDIREIQKLLATDPEIYPEGLTTGYYGKLTREALKRFQKKNGLEVTGAIDEDTRALLEEYLSEKFGDTIPVGLSRAPGIQKKIEMRLKEGCESRAGKGVLCTKLKAKYSDDDDEEKEYEKKKDHDHEDESDDSEDEEDDEDESEEEDD